MKGLVFNKLNVGDMFSYGKLLAGVCNEQIAYKVTGVHEGYISASMYWHDIWMEDVFFAKQSNGSYKIKKENVA